MKDLENVIPNPLNKNMTINKHYSYDYISSYVNNFNNNEKNESQLSTYYYATIDFSGLETTNFLSKKYICQAIKNIPKQTYKLNSNFYIPAIGELSMAMEKVQTINNVLKKINKKQIDLNKTFISSTLYDPYTVWDFDMNYAKISYNSIDEKRSVLPFFRYEPLKNNIFDYESDNISNDFKDFNLFITLDNNISFDNYVFASYYKNNLENDNWITHPYPIYESNNIFVGMPYKNINKKDKLKFYIVIPAESIVGEYNEDTINNYIVEQNFDELKNYILMQENVNPFIKNLLLQRPNFYQEIYNEANGVNININLNINYIKCIIYTFEKYLDIFEFNYREIFELSNNTVLNCAEYINNKKQIKFEFDRLGYFDKNYCIAIGIEIRYYKSTDLNYDILYRNFFFYNNYNILISFDYTNKIGIKYLSYTSQPALQSNSINDSQNNYIYVDNYKTNNYDLMYFLTNYLKFTKQKNILVNSENNEIRFQFNFNKNIYEYLLNSTILDENQNNNNNITELKYIIRSYFNKGKTNGIFGKIVEQDISFNDISFINGVETIPLQNFEKNYETDEISFSTYNNNRDQQPIQHDIIFVQNGMTISDTYKKIIINNNSGDHVNIWIEDEYQRLCTGKVRLCIPPGYKFITYASIFLESYFIKLNIELYNKYTFGNKSYSNILINNSDTITKNITKL